MVMAEVDRVKASLTPQQVAAAVTPRTPASQRQSAKPNGQASKPAPAKPAGKHVCESCGAAFDQDLKFCGECGKPMKVVEA